MATCNGRFVTAKLLIGSCRRGRSQCAPLSMSFTLHQCIMSYMDTLTAPSWLLLVISLPTSSATGRMRIWRSLRALGCVALRDGAYLLPSGPGRAEALRDLGAECAREGGSAWLMTVMPDTPDD